MVDEPGGDKTARAGREGAPAGDVYEWYHRAMDLLSAGSPEAAAELLRRARDELAPEPGSASVLEALARAEFDSGRYAAAAELFSDLAEQSPDNDYARFGLGLSRTRLGDFAGAIDQLAMAAAMRPERRDYEQALREARATLRARGELPS